EPVVDTAAIPERLREPPGLQRPLHARGVFRAHVRTPTRRDAGGVDHHRPVGSPHEPYQRALGAAPATAQARAERHMLHASAGGRSPSAAVTSAVGSAAGSRSACAATHATAAA